MNSPLSLIQALKNPQGFMQNIMQNNEVMQNPLAKNAMEMFQKGDTKGLQKMAENLCKERGTTMDDVKNMIMKQMGMNQ